MDALTQLLRDNPNCRVTIRTSRPRKTPVKNIGDLKLRSGSWWRWDYCMSQGAYLVGPRGAHRKAWHWDHEATAAECAEARRQKRERKTAKAL
ncbi:MAG: hypothetical protein V4630_18075 [Pseudomonadota bacterium]